MNYKKIKILLLPFVGLLIMLITISFAILFSDLSLTLVLKHIPLSKIVYVLFNWSGTVLIFYFCVKYVNQYFSWHAKWKQHFIIDILIVVCITIIDILIFFQLDKLGVEWTNVKEKSNIIFYYVIPLMMKTIFLVMIEIVLSIEERMKLSEKLVKTEQLHSKAKYDVLKSQLDHHFLFNNLSVLSSIIYEDVEKADKFIQKFSQIYRYVLDTNKHNLVPLHCEVDFIDSYLNLYKSRFEQGIDYQIVIGEGCDELLLPPLTLQVLIENSIQHNLVSKKHPLSLQVFTEDNYLIVKNNIQRCSLNVVSTKTGLANIKAKYELMELELPIIENTGDYYIVKVPLVK